MTKLDIDSAVVLIAKLFPSASKWTPERVDVLREGMARIQVSAEQAAAVIREYRRVCKYNSPSEADLLAMLKRASGDGGQQARADAPKTESRVAMLRLVLGIEGGSDGDVVRASIVDAAERAGYAAWVWRRAVEEYRDCLGIDEADAMPEIEHMLGPFPSGWREARRQPAKGAK